MLSLSNIHASYGAVEVLHGIDLHIEAGELVTVIGSNGAGKTTLLKTISGLMKSVSGRIEFEGRDLLKMTSDAIVRAGIVHVPEGRMVLSKMTVMENLKLGAYIRTDAAGVRRDLDHVVEMFPWLKERLTQAAGTLSGGEQQMLAIARGLMCSPRLLLLDEPSLGVAPIIVDQIFEAIGEVQAEGVTILLVEQNAARALGAAQRGYALELGSVLFSDTGEALLSDDRVRQAYLGV